MQTSDVQEEPVLDATFFSSGIRDPYNIILLLYYYLPILTPPLISIKPSPRNVKSI